MPEPEIVGAWRAGMAGCSTCAAPCRGRGRASSSCTAKVDSAGHDRCRTYRRGAWDANAIYEEALLQVRAQARRGRDSGLGTGTGTATGMGTHHTWCLCPSDHVDETATIEAALAKPCPTRPPPPPPHLPVATLPRLTMRAAARAAPAPTHTQAQTEQELLASFASTTLVLALAVLIVALLRRVLASTRRMYSFPYGGSGGTVGFRAAARQR